MAPEEKPDKVLKRGKQNILARPNGSGCLPNGSGNRRIFFNARPYPVDEPGSQKNFPATVTDNKKQK
jgi:hypothetical protein